MLCCVRIINCKLDSEVRFTSLESETISNSAKLTFIMKHGNVFLEKLLFEIKYSFNAS